MDSSLGKFAVKHYHPCVDKFLVANKAGSNSVSAFLNFLSGDSDRTDEKGAPTMAHWAAEFNQHQLLTTLVKNGANAMIERESDGSSRTVLDIAIGSTDKQMQQWARLHGTFWGRYKLEDSHIHCSETCLVIFALDLVLNLQVTLKLMRNEKEWQREQEMRRLNQGKLDSKRVLELLGAVDLEQDAGNMDSRLKGEHPYRYMVIMKRGKRDLNHHLSHYRVAGRNRPQVIKILKQVAQHLKYLNEHAQRIHGDLVSDVVLP